MTHKRTLGFFIITSLTICEMKKFYIFVDEKINFSSGAFNILVAVAILTFDVLFRPTPMRYVDTDHVISLVASAGKIAAILKYFYSTIILF